MRAPVALTCGDVSGIGPELALKAWARRNEDVFGSFFYVGPAAHIQDLAQALGLSVPIAAVGTPAEAVSTFLRALPVLDQRLDHPVASGRPNAATAALAKRAIDAAVALTRSGQACALVTNPIHKQSMYQAGFAFPGHTEYLASLCGVRDVAMLLAIPGLRVVPVTVHMSLADAIACLTTEKIIATARLAARELRARFGIPSPRLAIAALNPHAGEGGSLGREEVDIIAPAVRMLASEGIAATGPHPIDTLFHARARRMYDAALCMTHDHALIPLKTIDFDRGVNVTLGLPIIRTSPDHGTAHDIAGRGVADPSSLAAAIKLAQDLAVRNS